MLKIQIKLPKKVIISLSSIIFAFILVIIVVTIGTLEFVQCIDDEVI